MSASSKLRSYSALSLVALLAAVASGQPALVALAAPFLLFAIAGLATSEGGKVDVRTVMEQERVLEGEELALVFELRAGAWVDWLLVEPRLPPGVEAENSSAPVIVSMRSGETRSLSLRIRGRRWGAYRVGELRLTARDAFGVTGEESSLMPSAALKVYPSPERAGRLVEPLRTQPGAGSQLSRLRGDGVEFADLRPFVPGDRVRDIHWRATARHASPWVIERHPERNTDVVLFLDTFAQVRGAGTGTLDLTVRAAHGLARGYLARHDRVGLLSFGGLVNWLTPGSGLAQVYRIVDSLLTAEIVFSYVWKDVRTVPRRVLPPQALVLVISPMLDDRGVSAALDLRARGYDVAFCAISPAPLLPHARGEAEQLARRLWTLRREAVAARCERLGVPVGHWTPGRPLDEALVEVNSFRRRTRQPLSA